MSSQRLVRGLYLPLYLCLGFDGEKMASSPEAIFIKMAMGKIRQVPDPPVGLSGAAAPGQGPAWRAAVDR